MADYCAEADVNVWLAAIDTGPLVRGGATISTLVAALIPLATATIDDYIGQSLLRQTRTVRRDGSGTRQIQLPNFPIDSITSLKLYFGWENLVQDFQQIRYTQSVMLGLAASPATANSQAICERDNGLVTIDWSNTLLQQANDAYPLWAGRFDRDDNNIEVTYTCGFNTVPADVVSAAAMIVAIMIAQMAVSRTTQGATSVSIGSVSKTWGDRPYAGLVSTMEQAITRALQRFCVGFKAVNNGWASAR